MKPAVEKAARLAILLKEANDLAISLNIDHGLRQAHTPSCMIRSVYELHMGMIIKEAKGT